MNEINLKKTKVFQTWKTKNLHPKINKLRNNMINENKELEFLLYTNQEMDNSVEDLFSDSIVKSYFQLNHYVARSDFWRYLILFKYGGVYLDIDSLINKNINSLLKQKKSILTLEPPKDTFIQWVLIFNKKDLILEKCIELIIENIKLKKFKNDILNLTGPKLFTKAVKEILKINNNKEIDVSIANIFEKLNTKNYMYLHPEFHDEYFLFKHKYNHLLRENKRKFYFKKIDKDNAHWTEFQKVNEVY